MRNWKVALSAALLMPLLSLCADEPPNGEAIFNQSCASCHGTEGAGGRGPSLRGQLRNGNQSADLKNVILNGLPGTGMPKFHFKDDDLRVLIPYIQSLSGRSRSASPPPGDPVAGKRIYDSLRCSACHKIGNEGSAFGPNLTRIGAARSYAYIKTSILSPSSDVPETYQGVTITTGDGKRHRGVRVNEDSFTVQLRLPDQSFASFDKQAIAKEVMEKDSLMPAYKLSDTEIQNLLAYLSGLVGSSDASGETKKETELR